MGVGLIVPLGDGFSCWVSVPAKQCDKVVKSLWLVAGSL